MSAYAKTRVCVSMSDWTPIKAPIPCNYFSLKNLEGSELLLRTDSNDPNTEDVLEKNEVETVTSTTKHVGEFFRFAQEEIVLWVKATSGQGPVVVTWVA